MAPSPLFCLFRVGENGCLETDWQAFHASTREAKAGLSQVQLQPARRVRPDLRKQMQPLGMDLV